MAVPDVAVLAGSVSTAVFVASYLPMLVKAARSKDLSSYSALNLALANVGNLVHSVYVFSLPAGPLWALHSFYLVASALMLIWWARYRRHPAARAARLVGSATPSRDVVASGPGVATPPHVEGHASSWVTAQEALSTAA